MMYFLLPEVMIRATLDFWWGPVVGPVIANIVLKMVTPNVG